MNTTTTAKSNVNYTAAQEAIMLAAIIANDGVANKALAETLISDTRLDAPVDSVKPGPRNVRSLVAKLKKICEQNPETTEYEKVAPKSKTGGVPTTKTALVARIVAASGLQANKLTGLDNAPKAALEALAGFAEFIANEQAA